MLTTLTHLPAMYKPKRKAIIVFIFFCVVYIALYYDVVEFKPKTVPTKKYRSGFQQYFHNFSPPAKRPEYLVSHVVTSRMTQGPGSRYNFSMVLKIEDGKKTWNRRVAVHNTLPPNIRFVHNNPVFCTRQPVDVLFYVISSPKNTQQRHLVRSNWGKVSILNGHNYRTLFFVGLTTPDVQQRLDREMQEHDDVIQVDVVDAYTNLTLKVIAAIGWMSTYCSHVDYVIKIDDDVVIDLDYLDRLLTAQVITKLPSRKIICAYFPHSKPFSDPKSKFYVPGNLMTLYPPYCDGAFYGYPASLLPVITHVTRSTPIFPMEDIYVMGIVLPQTQAKNDTFKYIDIKGIYVREAKPALHRKNTFIFANLHDPNTFNKVSTHVLLRRKTNLTKTKL